MKADLEAVPVTIEAILELFLVVHFASLSAGHSHVITGVQDRALKTVVGAPG